MKNKFFIFSIAILFGLSTVCVSQSEAQTENSNKTKTETTVKKSKKPKKLSKKEKLALDKLKKDYNNAMKKGDAAYFAKKYLDAKAAYTTASTINPEAIEPQQRIASVNEWLDKKADPLEEEAIKARQEKQQQLENELIALKNEKARLTDSLKVQLNAKQAYVDSVSKKLIAFEKQAIENKTYEKAKVEVPPVIVNAPVNTVSTPVDSIKKPVVVPKKTGTQTTYVTARMGSMGKWTPTPKNEKTIVPMPKKGTIVDDGQVVRIRKSDLETGKYDEQIAFYKSQGREVEEVQK